MAAYYTTFQLTILATPTPVNAREADRVTIGRSASWLCEGDYPGNYHTWTAPAISAAASQEPSADQLTAWTQSLNCPPRGLPASDTSLPLAVSQSRTTVSRPDDARCRPSGWKARSVTPYWWPGVSARTFL